MKFGSLFSGIGGLDLGLERAGMECAWQVEIDDYCARVLEKHWPSVTKHKDVRDVGKENLKPVDLIAGGFPCQPHSVAGKRRGAEDDRNLWPEFIRVIRETKPRYVLAENVPGIITTYLDTVLSDLEGEGYTCWTFNLPACGFDAPHRRERIFIVAYDNSQRRRIQQVARVECKDQANTYNNGKERNMAYTNSRRCQVSRLSIRQRRQEQAEIVAGGSCKDVADTDTQRLSITARSGIGGIQRQVETSKRGELSRRNTKARTYWTIEPDVGRVAHGIPSRVDRLRGLGNAVVPQVAEWIGKRIVEHEGQE